MIVFGWGGGKRRDYGEAVPVQCPNCHNRVLYHYVTSTKWFRLYLIPLIPYQKRHLLLCPVCSRGMELRGEARAEAPRLVEATRALAENAMDRPAYQEAVDRFWRAALPEGDRPAGAGSLPPPPARSDALGPGGGP